MIIRFILLFPGWYIRGGERIKKMKEVLMSLAEFGDTSMLRLKKKKAEVFDLVNNVALYCELNRGCIKKLWMVKINSAVWFAL